MKWEEFKKQREERKELSVNMKRVDIQCPECGKDIFLITNIILSCYPPKNSYICKNCGWGGSA